MEDQNRITYFAQSDHRNKQIKFGIKAKDRSRHMYVIGKTGMGKSTMLENMAIQDIQNGEGLAFIDPHGGTAEKLLDYVPENRIKDVIYFAPFDLDNPIAFNVMEDVGKDKRHLIANGLLSVFKKIWVDAWSGRMEYLLSNTILALLEYPNSTLLSVNRMLTEKAYRKEVVANVKDPSVKAFWVEDYGKWDDRYAREAGAAIQNKVGQFTTNPVIRNIVGQSHSSFDIRKIMDEKKILIMNLSKGLMGEQNSSLLGGLLITKLYIAAMSRADTSETDMSKLPNFYFFVDEFQSFANESFADILSEARKYKLNLTIAHQYIEQMPEEVRAAVFGNVGTMAIFRVGAYDAEIFEKEFAPEFIQEDIVSLGFAQIYLKLMIDGIGSKPFSATTLPPLPLPKISFKQMIIESSRGLYAKSREDVEKEILNWHTPIKHDATTSTSGKKNFPSNNFLNNNTNEVVSEQDKKFKLKQGDKQKPYLKIIEPKEAKEFDNFTKQKSSVKEVSDAGGSTMIFPKNSEVVKKEIETTDNKNFKEVFTKMKNPLIAGGKVEQNIEVKKERLGVAETAISLDSLKKSKQSFLDKKDKGPSEENLRALREALAGALDKEVDNLKKEEVANNIPAQIKPVFIDGGQKQLNTENSKEGEKKKEIKLKSVNEVVDGQIKEVPEDVLNNILND